MQQCSVREAGAAAICMADATVNCMGGWCSSDLYGRLAVVLYGRSGSDLSGGRPAVISACVRAGRSLFDYCSPILLFKRRNLQIIIPMGALAPFCSDFVWETSVAVICMGG